MMHKRSKKLEKLHKDQDHDLAWYDATLEADHWFDLKDIAPDKAAMLLCQFNPHNDSFEQAEQVTNDETGPQHLRRLLERFEDLQKAEPRSRSLADWMDYATSAGLKHHSWAVRYRALKDSAEIRDDLRPAPQGHDKNQTVCVTGDDESRGNKSLSGRDWQLNSPDRFPGYRKPLYDLLRDCHLQGKPCPRPREVLDVWKIDKPAVVHEVLDQELKYFDANGRIRIANLKSIQQAIRRLIR